MTTKDTGGSAFPVLGKRWHPYHGFHDVESLGMDLRDYFAAKAMQGYCAREDSIQIEADAIAADAYRIADAMLAARKEES